MARILHIEDDEANRLLVRKLLRHSGHEILDAEDGLDGVRLALSTEPDLILVDVNIPGLDGLEVVLRLRAEEKMKNIPIVAITAEGDREATLAVGCTGFIQKPIAARSFANTIEQYLSGVREITTEETKTRHLREQSQRIVGHLEQKVEELSHANAKLQALVAARSAFYRNVSHELATPMTPIVGYIELLLTENLGPLAPSQKKALGAMNDCIKRLRWQVDSFLDVTALETQRVQFLYVTCDFGHLVRNAIEECQARTPKSAIKILSEIPSQALPMMGDKSRLERAIIHMIENAMSFSKECIGVRVEQLQCGHYQLCVADNGPGIGPNQQPHIFEPFYQIDGSTTREHGGIGVGLAIAKQTAVGHGGTIQVTSPCNEMIRKHMFRGTTFYFSVSINTGTSNASLS